MKQENFEKRLAKRIIKIIEDRKIEKEKMTDEEKIYVLIEELTSFINDYSY